jgi:hypothetical protein
MTPNELEAYDAMIADRDRWKELAERLDRFCTSDATDTDMMIYRWNCDATHPVMRVRDAVAYARQLERERDKARTAARKMRDAFATGERLPWENI